MTWLVLLLATLTLSDVLVAFSWQVMLSKRIGLSRILVWLGLMPQVDSLTPGAGAVIVSMVYLVLPFTMLTLYPSLSTMPAEQLEAARLLGATPRIVLRTVIIPLNRAAALTAFAVSALLALGTYVCPLVLGRPQNWTMAVMIGNAALAGHNLPIAYARWRHRSSVAGWLAAIARLPFLLPLIVLGILFLSFWSWIGHVGRIENTILSHAVVFVGLPVATLAIGFRSIDPACVDAARTMGAHGTAVFRTVLVPLLLPYVACGMIFVFILSLNEYIIAYLVAGYEVETLPIKVFNSLRMGFQPTMCVGAMLFVAVGVLGFVAIAAIGDLPKLLGGRPP